MKNKPNSSIIFPPEKDSLPKMPEYIGAYCSLVMTHISFFVLFLSVRFLFFFGHWLIVYCNHFTFDIKPNTPLLSINPFQPMTVQSFNWEAVIVTFQRLLSIVYLTERTFLMSGYEVIAINFFLSPFFTHCMKSRITY